MRMHSYLLKILVRWTRAHMLGRLLMVACACSQAEEQKLASLEKQIKLLKSEQFKKGQVLFGLREQEKELSSELAGGQAQSKNLGSKVNQLSDEVSIAL